MLECLVNQVFTEAGSRRVPVYFDAPEWDFVYWIFTRTTLQVKLLIANGRIRSCRCTRSRGSDPGEDAALAYDMLLSEKEHEEFAIVREDVRNRSRKLRATVMQVYSKSSRKESCDMYPYSTCTPRCGKDRRASR